MSYIKLGSQKEKATKTNSANQLSVGKLKEMLNKKPIGKIKDGILTELAKREKYLKRQAKKLK